MVGSTTPPAGRERWFATGHAGGEDVVTAARAAARAALIHPGAKLVVVFAPVHDDLPLLLDAVREEAGAAAVIGCTTAGEITATAAGDVGVVVAALGGDGFRVGTASAQGADAASLRAAASSAASAAAAQAGPATPGTSTVAIVLADGMARDHEAVLRGAYTVLGPRVPIIGGCAGDGLAMTGTFQLHDGKVLTDAVVAAAVHSTGPIGLSLHHGWSELGDALLVTEAEDGHIRTLDGRPALDVYEERTGVTFDPDADHFENSRVCAHHPIGLISKHGLAIRALFGVDVASRSIQLMAHVPPGDLVWVMRGDGASLEEGTRQAARTAVERLGGHPPLGALVFDCIGRRGVLGLDGVDREGEILTSVLDAPLAGFFTYGEFHRTRGITGFHNQSLAMVAFG